MRICVVSRRDPTRDPTTRALIATLHSAGNEVTVVTGSTAAVPLAGVTLHTVGDPAAAQASLRDRLRRHLPASVAHRVSWDDALRGAVAGAEPDIVYAATETDLDLAGGAEAAVARRPEWPDAGPRDLIRLAPNDVRLSASPAGPPGPFHLPDAPAPPPHPAPGRHHGTRVAVAARFTATNPSRYLVAAFERAGVEVIVLDGAIDFARVAEDTRAIVVVESPRPALEVIGAKPAVPILFWVHHGEHHLMANLRLTRRYGADAVLLAHSWHLAHRFDVPVHRFPFAVAPELTAPGPGFEDRILDVAMVGAGLDDPAGRYTRRQAMAADLAAALPTRTGFCSGLPPEDMAALYRTAKIVVNDGGNRHYPITMRVFEALGSGSLLLTDDLPGTDVLLRPGGHYVALGPDPVGQVQRLLADPATETIARNGQQYAAQRHTYDHRVDELLTIAGITEVRHAAEWTPPVDPLAAAVDRDVEVHSVAVLGGCLNLPDRAVRCGDDAAARLEPGKTDAVVIGGDGYRDLDTAVRAARRYVYADPAVAETVKMHVAAIRPEAAMSTVAGILRADLGTPGYRLPLRPVGEVLT